MHLPWNFDPKPVVSEGQATQAMKTLVEKWPEIAGEELSAITRPLAFTGSKNSRLLVYADISAKPPWGSWTELGHGPERREFSRFRAAVNAAIEPLLVDHIDFVHDEILRKE
jgi:Dna[CI] antecedent, DciA